MKEFMFIIRKQIRSEISLSLEQHQRFLKSCKIYINNLKSKGRLISAQPIEWSGKIISGNKQAWKQSPFDESREVIGGYYHILATSLDEAIDIAKANPELQYNPDARIEVRPIKMKENKTGYVYPTEAIIDEDR